MNDQTPHGSSQPPARLAVADEAKDAVVLQSRTLQAYVYMGSCLEHRMLLSFLHRFSEETIGNFHDILAQINQEAFGSTMCWPAKVKNKKRIGPCLRRCFEVELCFQDRRGACVRPSRPRAMPTSSTFSPWRCSDSSFDPGVYVRYKKDMFIHVLCLFRPQH